MANDQELIGELVTLRMEVDFANHVIDEIKPYLLSHEDDIAYKINDFDDLREIFKQIIGREPQKDNATAKPQPHPASDQQC